MRDVPWIGIAGHKMAHEKSVGTFGEHAQIHPPLVTSGIGEPGTTRIVELIG